MSAAVNVLVMTPDELEALLERAALRAISAKQANDVLLSTEEAARQLGISANALRKRVHRGLLAPDVVDGKTHQFAQSTVDAYKRRNAR